MGGPSIEDIIGESSEPRMAGGKADSRGNEHNTRHLEVAASKCGGPRSGELGLEWQPSTLPWTRLPSFPVSSGELGTGIVR